MSNLNALKNSKVCAPPVHHTQTLPPQTAQKMSRTCVCSFTISVHWKKESKPCPSMCTRLETVEDLESLVHRALTQRQILLMLL